MKKLIIVLLIFLCSVPGKSQTINTFLDQTGIDLVKILEDCDYKFGPKFLLEDGDTVIVFTGNLYGYPVKLELKYRIFVTELIIDFQGSELEELFLRLRDDLDYEHSYCLGTSPFPNMYLLFYDDYCYILSFYNDSSFQELRFSYFSYGEKNKNSESLKKLG